MLEKMVDKWRFITLGRKNGFFNTALDEALIESVSNGSPPTIVLTEWEPTVSLGNSQNYDLDVNKEACEKRGVKITRRKSGGQAVFLDESYIVFSVVAPNSHFSAGLEGLRRQFSESLVRGLQDLGVSAEFYKPDNVILQENGIKKTIGNSGQRLTAGEGANSIHGSVRYSLTSFDEMIEVLKINGTNLHKYKEDIRAVLGAITDYSDITREKAVEVLSKRLLEEYSKNNFYVGKLTSEEESRVEELSREHYGNYEQIRGGDHYRSRGVCHFFLNGVPIVESVKKLLPYNQPSS